MSERYKYRLEKQETLADWKARAEKAEAELSTKSLQCERHKKARYQIELECMKLTKENHDLKAEVERLRRCIQTVIDYNKDRLITLEDFCRKLEEATKHLKAKEQG